MRRIVTVSAAMAMMMLVLVAPAGAVPADGNGNKSVVPVVGGPFDIPCDGGEALTLNVDGCSQARNFDQPNDKNVFLEVFRVALPEVFLRVAVQ